MPTNDFEGQVQTGMGNLKLMPSDEVWTKVEAQIRKEKKRRGVLIILSVFIFFLLGGMLWFFHGKKGLSISNSPGNTINDQASIQKRQTDNKQEVVKKGNSMKIYSLQKENDLSAKKNNEIIRNIQTADVNNYSSSNKKIKRTRSKTMGRFSGGADMGNDIAVINNSDTASNTVISNIVSNIKGNDSSLLSADTSKKMTKTNAPLKTKDISDKKKKKGSGWKIGISTELGVSFVSSSFLQSGNMVYGATAPPLSSGYTPGSAYISPKLNTGLGFNAEVFVYKNISPKTELLIGLSYRLMSNGVNIGTKLGNAAIYNRLYDSLHSSAVYSSGTDTKKVYYHLIELPMQIQIKILQTKKLPVYVMAGISIFDLLHTNSLQFDSKNDLYYQKNDFFNRLQFSVSGGLLFGLNNSQHAALRIGPVINYSISKIGSEGIYADKHYCFLGIRLQKFLAKNN